MNTHNALKDLVQLLSESSRGESGRKCSQCEHTSVHFLDIIGARGCVKLYMCPEGVFFLLGFCYCQSGFIFPLISVR